MTWGWTHTAVTHFVTIICHENKILQLLVANEHCCNFLSITSNAVKRLMLYSGNCLIFVTLFLLLRLQHSPTPCAAIKMWFKVLYLVWAAIVEAEIADGGDLGVQDLLLSLQLLLHLSGLGEGLGHRLMVVQVGCGGQRRQQVCWNRVGDRQRDTGRGTSNQFGFTLVLKVWMWFKSSVFLYVVCLKIKIRE